MIDLNLNPSRKELRTFSLLWAAFLALVAWIVWRRTGSSTAAWTLVAVGMAGALLGLVAPRAMRPVFVGLMIVNYPVGWLMTNVLLAAIFYVVVTPLGIIMRLTGRDPMQRRFDREAPTYWTPRRRDESPSRYFRQF
jgi:hypothetical protein